MTSEEHLAVLREWGPDTFDEHWEAVHRFVAEVGTDAARAAALAWCDGGDPGAQSVGLDVLGVLVRHDPELLTPLLAEVERAADSPDDDVRWSAAVALQYQEDPRVLPLVIRFLDDPDSDVRFQAVHSLPLVDDDDRAPDSPEVLALLRALEDPDGGVRDWAAFGLGVQLDVDTPEIRDALARHLHDDGASTAGEVAVGLAKRRDPRVYDVIAEHLADPDVGNLYLMAAAELADPRLVPLLKALRSNGWHDEDEPRPDVLDDALARCSGAG